MAIKQSELFPKELPDGTLAKALFPDGTPKFAKTVRIAVTGDVRITEAEQHIIDTSFFQRLRGIHQLGAALYVYPTAVHTRFDHSLGVLCEVDCLIVKIKENAQQGSGPKSEYSITPKQRLIARLYALLHDITHVPFGHTLEDELHIFPSHDGFQKRNGDGSDRFDFLLGKNSIIASIITDYYDSDIYDRFISLFKDGGKSQLVVSEDGVDVHDEVLYFLVSNTVCADLVDYLKRDSFFLDSTFLFPSAF